MIELPAFQDVRVYSQDEPGVITHEEWDTRRNVKAIHCGDGAYWVEHFVCRHDIVGNRWGDVPGMWHIERGYYYSGHVVGDFGDLVEVCGFYGD